MDSRNPVFRNTDQFRRGGYATFDTPSARDLEDLYSSPSATPAQTGRMTLDDVVVRTASLFGLLLVSAALTYFVWKPTSVLPVLGAAVVGFVLALLASAGGRPRPAVMMAYALVEGVFVGGVSYWYGSMWDGIVPQAVLGTLAAFAAMLGLYKAGVVRNSPRFQRTLLIAAVGYLIFGLVNLVGSMLGAWTSPYASGGLLAILLSALGVVLASFFLVLDFDFVEQGIRNGLPREFAWTAGFGLVVTLVWLYVEVLRLLAILRGDN